MLQFGLSLPIIIYRKAKYWYLGIDISIRKAKLQYSNLKSSTTIVAMYRLRIREEAEKRGFNQSSLSRASNISYVTIKKIWRNPAYEINIVTLHKIAQTLGVSTADLIEDIPEK